jgi:hypothetical protein
MRYMVLHSHDFTSSNALPSTRANHQGTWARQVPRSLQGPLSAPFLEHGNHQYNQDGSDEHQGIGRLSHDKVEACCGNEQQEHRFPNNLQDDQQQPALPSRSELVRTLLRRPALRFGCGEPEILIFLHRRIHGPSVREARFA